MHRLYVQGDIWCQQEKETIGVLHMEMNRMMFVNSKDAVSYTPRIPFNRQPTMPQPPKVFRAIGGDMYERIKKG